jgi:hypothetical protein
MFAILAIVVGSSIRDWYPQTFLYNNDSVYLSYFSWRKSLPAPPVPTEK